VLLLRAVEMSLEYHVFLTPALQTFTIGWLCVEAAGETERYEYLAAVTPLLHATLRGHLAVVQLLHSRGAILRKKKGHPLPNSCGYTGAATTISLSTICGTALA